MEYITDHRIKLSLNYYDRVIYLTLLVLEARLDR